MGGDVYPLWHVLADLAEWRGGKLIEREIMPLPIFTPDVATIAVRDAAGTHALVASLGREKRTVRLEIGESGVAEARIRTLDAATAVMAMTDPEAFRVATVKQPVIGDHLELRLDAYATVRTDGDDEPRDRQLITDMV